MTVDKSAVIPDRCRNCEYANQRTSYNRSTPQPYCLIAHCFIDELGGVCLMTLKGEDIRRYCDNYKPPEEMSDGKSCCLAHLHEARAFQCSVTRATDLLRDEDYDFKKPEQTSGE